MSLDEYLGEVDRSLRRVLSPEQRQDLLRELQSHYEERLEEASAESRTSGDDVIVRMGDASQVAMLERRLNPPRPERFLLLAGAEGERWPFLYGLGLSIWLVAIALVAGLGAMALLGARGNMVWDYPRFEEVNWSRLPLISLFYLKNLHLPLYSYTAAAAGIILFLALIGLLSTKYRFGPLAQALHIALVAVEVYLLAALCYTEFLQSDFFYVYESSLFDSFERWLSQSAQVQFGIITAFGFLVIFADSYLVAPRLKPGTRVAACAVCALAAFGSFHPLIYSCTRHFRIDSVTMTLVTVHLLVVTPVVLLVLLIVVGLPELLRAIERRAREGFGLALAVGVAASVLSVGILVAASAGGGRMNPILARAVSSASRMSIPTDKRVFMLFYSDGRVETQARLVNDFHEKLLADAAALPASALRLPSQWSNSQVNFALWLAYERGHTAGLGRLGRNIIRENPGLYPRYVHQVAVTGLGYLYLDAGAAEDYSRLMDDSLSGAVDEDSELVGLYLWQGDYPRARRYYEREKQTLNSLREQFGDELDAPKYVWRSLEANRVALSKCPAEADVVQHDVRIVARLDGKSLPDLEVGISPVELPNWAYLEPTRPHPSYASTETRYVRTGRDGTVDLGRLVSGPCAVAVSLSTASMYRIPGDRAILVRAVNLEAKTKDPATVYIDIVPGMTRPQLPVEHDLVAREQAGGDMGTLTWSPVKGATSYRILSRDKVIGTTVDTSFRLPRANDSKPPEYAVVALDSTGRTVGSDITLDAVARKASNSHDPSGHDWRRLPTPKT